jgi:hypothetical protein
MVREEEDDWEYEYDENETEDFYIPIDLTNVPSAQIPTNSERRPGHPTLLKSRLRALNATRGQLPETVAIDSTNTQEPATMGELQISGLHTTNPLVMYNGQLLSCQWTSTIGTDLYFTKPQTDEGESHHPLRSLPSVDLLSVGTAKLIARVGRLRPRDDLFENSEKAQPVVINVDEEETNEDETNATAAEGSAPIPANLSSVPNSFLARLNEAKARRGESSRLALAETSDGSRLVSEVADVPAPPGENGISQSPGDVPMGGT